MIGSPDLSISERLRPMSARLFKTSSISIPRISFSRVEVVDGYAWMLPNGTRVLLRRPSSQEQKLVRATHFPPHADLFTQQKLQSTPWKSKPSWYILCLQDHTVHPDLQRWVSKRMGATVTEVESSQRTHAL